MQRNVMPVVPQPSQMISIRRATNEDAAEILACLRAAFEDYRHQYTTDAFLDTVLTPETFQERLAEMIVFAAVNDSGKVVGTIACNLVSAQEGHLRGMAVLPSLRGSGIAGQLLSHAEEELRFRKCTRITLDTTEPLQRAMRFYEKHGYRRSEKIADFFGMPLVEYCKTLPSESAA
jgi:ribosomal protein S18 acetylase RimI-like enzyme